MENDNTMIKNAQDMCTLIRNVLNGERTDVVGMDIAAICHIAKLQTLTAITYMALEESGATTGLTAELKTEWKQEKDKAIRKNLLLTVAREQIFAEFEKAGIWYLPLKGSVLAELYPKTGMRQMADNDILFDPAYREKTRDIMVALGYEIEDYGLSNHDVYLKEPIYNFELHSELFSVATGKQYVDYYKEVAAKLLPDGQYKRKFKPEDFYIYILAHGHKHMQLSGNGLRFLLDCHVFLSKNTELDWEYVETELKELGMYEFEQLVRTTSSKLFCSLEELTAEEEALFRYCVESNTYGTDKIYVDNSLKKLQQERQGMASEKLTLGIRLTYIWRRIWPDKEWFMTAYPFFEKYKILKPFFIIWRIFDRFIKRGGTLFKELCYVIKKK